MMYNTLENLLKTNFSMKYHHKYSLFEIENLTPFERDFYIDMINEHLEKLEKQREEIANSGP